MVWNPFDSGQTLGTIGSENGIIICDEEHSAGARITLERGGYAPFAITCGIYGAMMHTAFASSEAEARTKYDQMKRRLGELLDEPDEARFVQGVVRFTDEF